MEYKFSSYSDLECWLKRKIDELGIDPAIFIDEWLQDFYEDGNVISVHGEELDYSDVVMYC